MKQAIKNNVSWIGKIDWELRKFHGDEYSTHRGSTYNSYLVEEEKVAVIDTVWAPFAKEDVDHLAITARRWPGASVEDRWKNRKERAMKATEDLVEEHHAVLVALKILGKVAAAVGAKEEKAPEHLEQLLEFFKGFVDRCHHGKEEDVLFPELERWGVKREGGPIGVMLAEHEIGRGHVRAMTERLQALRSGDAGAVAGIGEHTVAYRAMLEAHIQKENSVLFPMADRLIDCAVAERLAEQFEGIERERVGEGKHEAYHAMLHGLKEAYGVE